MCLFERLFLALCLAAVLGVTLYLMASVTPIG